MQHLSYTRGQQDKPLLVKTIGQAFDEAVNKYGHKEALVVKDQQIRYTWYELAEQVNACAKALLAIGLMPGDRVGIWSPNNAQWCVTQFATAKVGVILVNINPAYRLAELEYALNQSGCKWLIISNKFKKSDYRSMLKTLAPEISQSMPGELQAKKLPHLRGVISLDEEAGEGILAWPQLFERGTRVDNELMQHVGEKLQFDDPINIQYTSGTTGMPKGATLSHYNILNNGYMVGASQGLTDEDRMVIPVPLYHCFGMVMGNLGCLTHGTTMIYPSAAFDPELTLQAVAEEKATVLYGVPTMFIALLESPLLKQLPLDSLRTGIMAGSTCPIEVMKKVITDLHMEGVQIAYGMTETSPVSMQTAADDSLEHRVSTVGRTQPHLETKIIDNEGRIVPRGEVGELCTRGYSVMLGYWNNLEATQESIDAAGWMRTGDLAIMDVNGYVQIVGRNSDMIIRGGENIYPREIEEFLYTHEALADVQVIGIPDQQYGEEVVAWVKLRPQGQVSPNELIEFCRSNIAHFKVPKHIFIVDEFPMTISGKIQKFRMREMTQQILEKNKQEQ